MHNGMPDITPIGIGVNWRSKLAVAGGTQLNMDDLDPSSAQVMAMLSNQLVAARQALARGAVVMIAPDGYYGIGGREIAFMGRLRRFGAGFAELALEIAAPVVPVTSSVDLDGRITIKIGKPFEASGRSHAQRVDALIAHYIEHLSSVWRTAPGEVHWPHLSKFLALPPAT
jgi:KDO2-lipid IV(A) lauroyltransferase